MATECRLPAVRGTKKYPPFLSLRANHARHRVSPSACFQSFSILFERPPTSTFPPIFRFRLVKMRTTRSETNKAGDDASNSTRTLANKAIKKTSKAPLKPKSTTSKKATAGGKAPNGKKATGGKKAADENQSANGNDKPEKNSPSGLLPLPSPSNSVGDLIPHRNGDKNV